MSGEIIQLDFLGESNKPEKQEIDFSEVRFITGMTTTAEERFSGFTHLRAITFSYGVSFIESIARHFQDAEIIFGCEALLKYDIEEIMAFQDQTIAKIRRHKKLIAYVEEDRLRLRVAKEILAHEKIYIMWDDVGHTRVITGSANFSGRSFSGNQREDILFFENDSKAFDYYMTEYELLESLSTNEIVLDSLLSGSAEGDEDHTPIEKIPVVREALVKEAAAIVDNSGVDPESAEFMMDVSKAVPRMRKLNVEVKKSGAITNLIPEKLHELFRRARAADDAEQQKRREYPRLYIDYDSMIASFNGKTMDFVLNMDDVRSDIIQLDAFFAGYDDFIGSDANSVIKAKKAYFRFLNFMFMSPFVARLRKKADIYGYSLNYYPYFGILHGRKSAGKSELLDMIQKMMFGKRLERVESSKFTKTKIQEYLELAACVPIHINDISKKRFNPNCKEIIKSDDDLISSGNITYPVFVMTTNDIETLDEAIGKRTYYESVSITQSNLSATTKRRGMYEIRKKMTNALYREYLHRIIPKVKLMEEKMASLIGEEAKAYHPDLFQLSSETLIEIITDTGIKLPEYIYPVAYRDYFGTNAMIERAKDLVAREWMHNRNAFRILKKQNQLEYTAGEYAYQATALKESLPEHLRAFTSGLKVVMDLDAAEQFFGISFRRRRLPFLE